MNLAACGDNHSVCVDDDGDVWVFGSNAQRQLGMDGEVQDFYQPQRNPHLSNILFVACGFNHTACVDSVGNLWMFGANERGQLGCGNYQQIDTLQLITLESEVKSVACGKFHTICSDINGRLFGFGANENYQLGLTDKHTFSLLLDEKGFAWGAGDSSYGQLGSEIQKEITFKRVPNASNIIAVAAGYGHSLFLNDNGNVFSCGWNSFGQLGRKKNERNVEQIPDLPVIEQISVGFSHSMFIDQNRRLWTCGYDTNNQLGRNDKDTPVGVVDALENVEVISQGGSITIVKTAQGEVFVWGRNDRGQLGLGETSFSGRISQINDNILGFEKKSQAKSARK